MKTKMNRRSFVSGAALGAGSILGGAFNKATAANAKDGAAQGPVANTNSGKIRGVVQDRTIWEDTIFARMLNEHPDKIITDLDYNTYLDLFDNMVLRELVFPQILIYLDCSPETAIKRIGARGRVMEKAVPIEYLRMLKENYEQFIGEMEQAGVRILRIKWETFQPVSEVVRLVHEYSLKPSSFTKWVRPMRKTPEMKPKPLAPDHASV